MIIDEMQLILDDGKKIFLQNVEAIDECPICHKKIIPKTCFCKKNNFQNYDIIYCCTNLKCNKFFIANYIALKADYLCINYLEPKYPNITYFSDEISSISPKFIEIYNQSLAAETYNLSSIVGIGLRKGLEYLIKDYLISKYKDKEEEIINKFLGNCISTYINDLKIKSCAERSVWLGNDETHYLKKWENKDIEDLKTLIQLTIYWIESEILTEKYIKDMPK
jgi:hypothetical protein